MKKINSYYVPGSIIISLIFGFGFAYGYDILFWNPSTSKTILLGIGITLLYLILFYLLCPLLSFFKRNPIVFFRKFRNNLFRNSFIIIFLSWMGHLIIKYPAANCEDTYFQLQQGMGNVRLTSHHPIFHTLLMTWSVKAGQLFADKNIGIFAFVFLEALILAGIFSYSLHILSKKLAISDFTLLCSLLFFSLQPYIISYIGVTIKDIFFTGGVTLLIVFLIDNYYDRTSIFNGRMIVTLTISAIFVYLFRNNGKYLLFLTLVTIFLSNFRQTTKKAKLAGTLILVFLIPFLIENYLTWRYQPQKGSIAEALSLPLQQTARYVTFHEDIISEKEKEGISKILPFDSLPLLYNSFISNPVKDHYNRDATFNELFQYFRAWTVGLWKAPLCYINATVIQNIYLICPLVNNYQIHMDPNGERGDWYPGEPLFTIPPQLNEYKEKYIDIMNAWYMLPVIGIINNSVFYIWMLFSLFVYSIKNKNQLFLYISVPLIITFLTVIAGPAIKGNARYLLPIIWTFPIWFCCLVYHIPKK